MARLASFIFVIATVMLGLLSSIGLAGKLLDNCAKRMEFHCAAEAYRSVFKSGPPVSSACCAQMLRMGKLCNENLTKNIASMVPQFNNKKDEYLTKGQNTWEHCASIVKGGASPAL